MPRFKVISSKTKGIIEDWSWPDKEVSLEIEIDKDVKIKTCLENIRLGEAKQIIKFLQKHFNL
jgi:hypothetical protein